MSITKLVIHVDKKMIDFACKRFDINKVIKCSLALSKSDLAIFNFFYTNPSEKFTTEVIAKKLKFNLSTIQRSVKKLHEKNLLIRTQTNLDKGGYIFSYQIESKQKIRSLILNIVQTWVAKVETELKKV